MLRNKLIAITGGAGFIGSNLVHSLCPENEVIVIDNLLTGHYENISDIADCIRFIREDVNNLDMLMREFESADYVLHEAALPSVQRSVEDPVTTNRNNIDGTLNVLVAAKNCGVERVIFASSSSIYGDTSQIPVKETSPQRPLSPYAVTKLAGEHYCKIFHEVYGLETVSLRYFNVFGPEQDPGSEYAAVIPKFINLINNGGRPVVYGDGEQTRDFVFVEDVVRANMLACEAPKAAGKIFNIASGKGTSLNKLLDIIGKITDRRIVPIYTDPRRGDIRNSVADISQAREILGYRPQVEIEEGIRTMLSCLRC